MPDEIGIAIRYIKEYDIEIDKDPVHVVLMPNGTWRCVCGATVGGIRLVCEACHRHKNDHQPSAQGDGAGV